MEENKSQELPMDEETVEDVTEQAEADSIEVEEPEELRETESAEEPAEESIEEFTEESIEESAEELVAEPIGEPIDEPIEESNEAEHEVEAAIADENITESIEEVTEEPKAEDAKVVPAKEMPKGLVLQAWQVAVAAVIVVAMVAGGVLLGVFLGNKNYTDDFNGSPVDYDWVLPQGSNPGANQIVVPGYGDLLFTAGQKQIEIILPNPKNNPCYFRYTLLLDDTGEILYQSPLIAPGKAVLEIELSRALSKGDYHLTIAIDSISLADGRTPMNGAEHHVLLQVR